MYRVEMSGLPTIRPQLQFSLIAPTQQSLGEIKDATLF
jgi:hypothetical protein